MKIICIPLVVVLIATSVIDCTAQMPINKVFFKRKAAGLSPASTCAANTTEVDRFFYITHSSDSAVKETQVTDQIIEWRNALEKEISEIDPFLACYEAAFIQALKTRIENVQSLVRSRAAAGGAPGLSTAFSAQLKSMDGIINSLDTLHKGYSAVNRILGTPKVKNRFVPARNRAEASIMYQRYGKSFLQVGQNISFYGWDNRGTINPELLSFFAGPVRLAVNTLVSSTEKDKNTKEGREEFTQLRTLSGNGGNVVLGAYYPFYHTTTRDIQMLFQLSPKFATEAPILGSPFKADTLFANGNLGLDFNLSINLAVFGKSSFYMYARPAYFIGTKPYLDALNTSGNFFLMQETIGIDITNIGKIGFLLPPVTNVKSLRSNTFLLSLQLSPQNVIK